MGRLKDFTYSYKQFIDLIFLILKVCFYTQTIILTIFAVIEYSCKYSRKGGTIVDLYYENLSSMTVLGSRGEYAGIIGLKKIDYKPPSKKTFPSIDESYILDLNCKFNKNPSNLILELTLTKNLNEILYRNYTQSFNETSMDCNFRLFDKKCTYPDKQIWNLYSIYIVYTFLMAIIVVVSYSCFIAKIYKKEILSDSFKSKIINFCDYFEIPYVKEFELCYKDGNLYRIGKNMKVLGVKENFESNDTYISDHCEYKGLKYTLHGGILKMRSMDRYIFSKKGIEEVYKHHSLLKLNNIKFCFWHINNLGFPVVVGKHCLTPLDFYLSDELFNVTEPLEKIYSGEEVFKSMDFKYIYKKFESIYDSNMIKTLVLHNSEFFKGFNFSAMNQILKKKISFYDKAYGCTNSQWKMYVSDCNYLFMKYNNYLTIHNLRKPTMFCEKIINDEININNYACDTKVNEKVKFEYKKVIDKNENKIKLEINEINRDKGGIIKFGEFEYNFIDKSNEQESKDFKIKEEEMVKDKVTKTSEEEKQSTNVIQSSIKQKIKVNREEPLKQKIKDNIEDINDFIKKGLCANKEEMEEIREIINFGKKTGIKDYNKMNTDIKEFLKTVDNFIDEYSYEDDDKVCEYSEFDELVAVFKEEISQVKISDLYNHLKTLDKDMKDKFLGKVWLRFKKVKNEAADKYVRMDSKSKIINNIEKIIEEKFKQKEESEGELIQQKKEKETKEDKVETQEEVFKGEFCINKTEIMNQIQECVSEQFKKINKGFNKGKHRGTNTRLREGENRFGGQKNKKENVDQKDKTEISLGIKIIKNSYNNKKKNNKKIEIKDVKNLTNLKIDKVKLHKVKFEKRCVNLEKTVIFNEIMTNTKTWMGNSKTEKIFNLENCNSLKKMLLKKRRKRVEEEGRKKNNNNGKSEEVKGNLSKFAKFMEYNRYKVEEMSEVVILRSINDINADESIEIVIRLIDDIVQEFWEKGEIKKCKQPIC